MILDLLKLRFSARIYTQQKIEAQDVSDILEAGRLSPSGGNEQPWHFLVVNDPEKIMALSEACYDQSWIRTSPLAIILCVEPVSDERGCRNIQCSKNTKLKEEIISMQKNLFDTLNEEEHQTKIPGSYMSLVALEKGIHSTWVSYYDMEKVSMLFNIPERILPAEILIFGYPKKLGSMRSKKSIEELVHYNSF